VNEGRRRKPLIKLCVEMRVGLARNIFNPVAITRLDPVIKIFYLRLDSLGLFGSHA